LGKYITLKNDEDKVKAIKLTPDTDHETTDEEIEKFKNAKGQPLEQTEVKERKVFERALSPFM
jgi:hypothetical protein